MNHEDDEDEVAGSVEYDAGGIPVIYRWPDGSYVSCEVLSDMAQVCLRVFVAGSESNPEELWIGTSEPLHGQVDHGVYAERCASYPVEVEWKIVGFLLDLGVVRAWESPNLARSSGEEILAAYPLYVPDELFATRYDRARELLAVWPVEGRLLLFDQVEVFEGKTCGAPGPRRETRRPARRTTVTSYPFSVEVHRGAVSYLSSGASLEEAVDDLCDGLLILPESRRSAWEAEHIERGTWVLPSAEEVELYQMLGEELPFWWHHEKLEQWLMERP